MKPTPASQIQSEEDRKKRRAAERFRRWIEDLRRQMQRQERDRRRKWLLVLLLMLLESKPMQAFFPAQGPALRPVPTKDSTQRKSEKKSTVVETRSDYERRFLYDYAPRRGEEHLEVFDGLTYADIVDYYRTYRPHLFRKAAPIPGMPARYVDEPPHIWALLDHLRSDYHRKDAIIALKLLVGKEAHDWIDACAAGTKGNSWKDLKMCWRRTPDMTLFEFPRAAARWREQIRREAEEKKQEIAETLENGPKPPTDDEGNMKM